MTSFDLRVTLDAEGFERINDLPIADYSPMDGVFAQPTGEFENPDVLAAIYLENLAVIHGIIFNPQNMQRQITITVSKNAEEDEVRITAQYVYTLGTLTSETYHYEFFRERICNNADPCGRTCIRCVNKSVFVCYKPFYYGVDIIEIDNTTGMNLSVFLVKQSEPVNYPREANYQARIHQREPHGTQPGEDKTKVFTNFHIHPNLSPPDNRLPGAEIRIFRDASGWYYDATGRTTGELVSRTQRNRMFKITVEVFENGQLGGGAVGRPLLRSEATQLD
jgi:hypothetical protein